VNRGRVKILEFSVNRGREKILEFSVNRGRVQILEFSVNRGRVEILAVSIQIEKETAFFQTGIETKMSSLRANDKSVSDTGQTWMSS